MLANKIRDLIYVAYAKCYCVIHISSSVCFVATELR